MRLDGGHTASLTVVKFVLHQRLKLDVYHLKNRQIRIIQMVGFSLAHGYT